MYHIRLTPFPSIHIPFTQLPPYDFLFRFTVVTVNGLVCFNLDLSPWSCEALVLALLVWLNMEHKITILECSGVNAAFSTNNTGTLPDGFGAIESACHKCSHIPMFSQVRLFISCKLVYLLQKPPWRLANRCSRLTIRIYVRCEVP